MKSLYENIVVVAAAAIFLIATSILGLGIAVLGRIDGALAKVEGVRADVAVLRASSQVEYEYGTIAFTADAERERMGEDAAKFATITPSAQDLGQLATDGWEVVTSYLEMETAFPNFGNDRYVTGLQTNVRPQRLVLVLRRPKRAPRRA